MTQRILMAAFLVLALCGFKPLNLPEFISPNWTKVASRLHTGISTPMRSMEEVHLFVNKIPYLSDEENYGVPDYWAPPGEFFSNEAGDCEDFAIAKYALGIENGLFRPQDAMLVKAFDRQRNNTVHMLLIVQGRVYDSQSDRSFAVESEEAARYHMIAIVDTRQNLSSMSH